MSHRLAHHPLQQEPTTFLGPRFGVKIVRLSLLPLLGVLALLLAHGYQRPPEVQDLNGIHSLSVAAALLAFLCRPRISWRTAPTRQWILLSLGFLFYTGLVIGFFRAQAPEAAYPYCVLLLDALLIFYAFRQAARFYPAATLAFLVTTQLGILTLWILSPIPEQLALHSSIASASGPMIAAAGLLGALLLLATRGRRFGALRWWTALLLLSLCFAGFWALRIQTRLEESSDSKRPAPPRGKSDVIAAARHAFRSHPLTGIGLGSFESQLPGYGIADISGRALAGINAEQLPEPEASLIIQVSKPTPQNLAPLSANAPHDKKITHRLLQYTGLSAATRPSPALNSFQLYSIEIGSISLSLGIVTFLFISLAAVSVIAAAPRSGTSLLLAGLLALWAALGAEGLITTALHTPYGMLLFASLGGILWGTTDRMTRKVREELESALEKIRSEKTPAPANAQIEAKPLLESWTKMDPKPSDAKARKKDWFRSEDRSTTLRLLQEILRGLLPKRKYSALASLLLAVALVQITATPLRGLRAARAAENHEPASQERGALLRRAVALHPFSSDLIHRLAAHLQERHARETLIGKLSDTELVSLQMRTEALLRAARQLNPYREETYVIEARYHQQNGQIYKAAAAIADGRRYCPRSLLLSLWSVRQARNTGDPLRLEIALRDALLLTGPGHKEIRASLLKRLSQHLERQGQTQGATQAAQQHFQTLPGAPESNEYFLRNMAADYK